MGEANQTIVEFMRTRRSVPAKMMGSPGPGDDQLEEILTIAARSPDHGKIVPWRFIRYTPQWCERIGETLVERARALNGPLNEDQEAIERSRFTHAPVVVAVISRPRAHPKVPEWEQVLSSGAVAMNLLIAANAYGFDAQWITEWMAFDEELHPHLGLEDGERIAGFVHIGTRIAPKTERDRPNLADLLTVHG